MTAMMWLILIGQLRKLWPRIRLGDDRRLRRDGQKVLQAYTVALPSHEVVSSDETRSLQTAGHSKRRATFGETSAGLCGQQSATFGIYHARKASASSIVVEYHLRSSIPSLHLPSQLKLYDTADCVDHIQNHRVLSIPCSHLFTSTSGVQASAQIYTKIRVE